MSIKTLFSIIVKIIGILFIQNIISSLYAMSSIFVMYNANQKTWPVFDILSASFVGLLLYILLSWLFIFKTGYVINLLKLEEGFDEELLPLNIHQSTVLKIAVIVVGGYMLASSIPDVARQLYECFKPQNRFGGNTNYSYLVLSASKCIIGIILVGFQRPIVNLIALKSRAQ
jgi:hypothetical protein